MIPLTLAPGIASLKSRLRSTWMAGDYDRFSRFMENDARSFYERLDVPPGAHLLDVACGSGQVALMAAREGVRVTGVDIAENLIERAQARSIAEGLPARFQVADAESLPFPDSSFDVVVSLIGAMFAPRPHLVARELTPWRNHRHGQLDVKRVCGRDVPHHRKVHSPFRDAFTAAMGR